MAHRLWWTATSITILIFSGCATSPITRDMRKQISPGVTFEQVLKNPEGYKGKTVLWGGQILNVRNTKEATSLQVLQIPLDSSDRPTNPESSDGRFIAVANQYLDSAVYQAGRKITVLGEVQGQRAESLGQGQMEYVYPVLSIRNIYLWPRYDYRYPRYYDPYWDSSFGYWGPDWGTHFGLGFSVP